MRNFIEEFIEVGEKLKEAKKKVSELEAAHREICQDFLNTYFDRIAARTRELYDLELELSGGYPRHWQYKSSVFGTVLAIYADHLEVEDCSDYYDDNWEQWTIPFAVDEEKDKVLLEKATRELIDFYNEQKESKEKEKRDREYREYLKLKEKFGESDG
jgi:hypothetical protein